MISTAIETSDVNPNMDNTQKYSLVYYPISSDAMNLDAE